MADYKKDKVLKILAADCHEKCYICECPLTSTDKEHIISHRNDKSLEVDWNNIFLACPHCNRIKGMKYDDILNPVDCDPEKHIALSFKVTPEIDEHVQVEPLTYDHATLLTKELLDIAYNYNDDSNYLRKMECRNIRNKLLKPDIKLFEQYIRDFKADPDLVRDTVCDEIARSSIFAAFKRKIVRDDPDLHNAFADALA